MVASNPAIVGEVHRALTELKTSAVLHACSVIAFVQTVTTIMQVRHVQAGFSGEDGLMHANFVPMQARHALHIVLVEAAAASLTLPHLRGIRDSLRLSIFLLAASPEMAAELGCDGAIVGDGLL